MLLLIGLTSFGSVTLFVVGISMKSERVLIRERVESLSNPAPRNVDSVQADLSVPFRDRVVMPILRRLASFANKFTPVGAIETLESKLEGAGRPWRLGGKEFVGLKVLTALALLICGTILGRALDAPPLNSLLITTICTLAGFITPDAFLSNDIGTRRSRLRKSLADTLDLLTVSVEAGLGLDGAMQKVVEKQRGPLSEELHRALQEMQVGKSRSEALRDMAKRAVVPELGAFVASIVQADELGVSVAKVLRVQGDTIRARRSQTAREIAAKLPVKLLFPLVFFIFPAMYVVVVAPGAIQIGRSMGLIR